jgi:hypothetical protein
MGDEVEGGVPVIVGGREVGAGGDPEPGECRNKNKAASFLQFLRIYSTSPDGSRIRAKEV